MSIPAQQPSAHMHLCILENDDLDLPLVRRYTRVAAMFEHLLAQAGYQGCIDTCSARHGHCPDSFEACDAVLLTGSQADSFSNEPWVLALPPGATLLATQPDCPVAASALSDQVFCIQPHPEFTPEVSAFLLDKRRALMGESLYASSMDSLTQPHDGLALARFMIRFVQYGLSDPDMHAANRNDRKYPQSI